VQLYQIRYFLAVVDHQGPKVAAVLRVAQLTVSQAIRETGA
jgi:DNA-binding transcriptional LysR family regulator